MPCSYTKIKRLTAPNTKKIRIKDIAARANVSPGTVDRVLHNRGEVKEETRVKIMAIIDKFGYTPNLLAKSLASRKTHKLAVLIPEADHMNSYWQKPLIGIREASSELKDFNTEVGIFNFNATDEESFKKAVKSVLASKPEGVVFDPLFKETSLDFTEILDALHIPYVYIDVNLEKGNNLAYFGQEAERSGYAAAKLMSFMVRESETILVVKLADRKAISRHLNLREHGFRRFFTEKKSNNLPSILSVEIDMLNSDEPDITLHTFFNTQKNIKGIFVPNSRVYKVARYLEKNLKTNIALIGYDIIDENLYFLEKEVIDFIISQKPEDQGYKGLMALFNYIHKNKVDHKINYSPIDIIMKENIDYYKNFK